MIKLLGKQEFIVRSSISAGMLPMARELIKQGTAVIIAANSLPSINDITAQELTELLKQAGQVDKLIGRSLQEGILQVVESGSDLPVIDLSKVVTHFGSFSYATMTIDSHK